jgi:hypothetical protein
LRLVELSMLTELMRDLALAEAQRWSVMLVEDVC